MIDMLQKTLVFVTCVTISLCLWCSFALGSQSQKKDTKDLAAKGDDVAVSMDFVHKVRKYYRQNSVQRTDKQGYIRSGVEHWLFAAQAIKQGLAKQGTTTSALNEMTGKEIIKLHRAYISYLMDQENVSDEVLKSYYLSFPNKFAKSAMENKSKEKAETSNGTEGNASKALSDDKSEPALVPFDKVKGQIRMKLVGLKMSEIKKQAFTSLMEEYDMKIMSSN